MKRILTINPGSTSTKLAIYEDDHLADSQTLRHSVHELAPFKRIVDQYSFRNQVIQSFLQQKGRRVQDFDAVIGRGGLVRPIPSGTYLIQEEMLDDLRSGRYGEHASNLGALIAHEIVKDTDIPCFIADPVVVDEMGSLARYSGHPRFERKSIFHALNQKATARMASQEIGKPYEAINLVVVHLGGGISIGAHECGKVIDVNNALDGDGPFSPERCGTVPVTQLIDLCFSGKYTFEEMKKKVKGDGGIISYLNTNDGLEVGRRILTGDEQALVVFKAMAHQVIKWIGKMAAVLKGQVHGIVLTGGLAYDQDYMVPWIKEGVEFIAPVFVFPGGDEERALAMAALRVLRKEQKPKIYLEEVFDDQR